MDRISIPANKMRIGTAGWTIPTAVKGDFPAAGTHLKRYSAVFNAVEINSCFHRPHKRSTYQRWAACVPDSFKFSVKVPKEITHARRLKGSEPLLDSFLAEVSGLEDRLGSLLFQLPPSFAFDPPAAEQFLTNLRHRVAGPVCFELRHASWFIPEVDTLFAGFRIARVAADPALVPQARRSGGWVGLRYCRLHGSPKIYHSPYSEQAIRSVVEPLRSEIHEGDECWCIFDNTASGAATANALTARLIV
ncbi:MAG: hypothetical protein JWS10_132 [Cypionkella sp.]|uniref:DUF72 domain-containing protein n=1 Tax=Cypionkella sp. TaxID=2811411 RepID=UPI00260EFF57|nr:DUF72 domain-containing protein [Cypionkella sp.]MDB5657517.1 hypothetical protein [Cypionkella sp.]